MFKAWWYLDRRMIRGWFKDQRTVKILVILGFAITLGLVALGIYTSLSHFLGFLISYEVFGRLIASYILNAAILIVVVMAIFSNTASLYASLIASRQAAYYLTMPIKTQVVTRALAGRVLWTGAWPFIVILVPVILAWVKVEPQVLTYPGTYLILPILILGSFALSIWLTALIEAINHILGKKGWWLVSLMALAVIICLIKLILPPKLFLLNDAPNQTLFEAQFDRLPLMQPWLVTLPVAQLMTQYNPLNLILISILTLGLFLISVKYLEKKHFSSWYFRHDLKLNAGPKAINGRKKSFYWPKTNNIGWNLAYVDYLRLKRHSGEITYFILVLVLTVFFTGVMSIFPKKMPLEANWAPLLYGAVMSGFGFLVTVMAIRFIYPLMALDAHAAWQLFSAPVKRWRLFDGAILYSLIIALPWLLLGGKAGMLLPLTPGELWLFGLMMMLEVLGVLIINLSLGFIAPNFNQGDNASLTSTSVSGLLALIGSIAWVALITKAFLSYQNIVITPWIWSLLLGVVVCELLMVEAIYKLNRYPKI